MAESGPEFRIETQRLVLRDWRWADVEPFLRLTNTPAVMRWLGGVMDQAAQDAVFYWIDEYRRDSGHTFWLVERQDDGGHLSGELLGFCGLKRCNQAGGPIGDVEIGWRLREDAWGRGYAREAAQAALRAGFETFGAPRIVALTVEGNAPSWRLMQRLGMTRRPELDFADSTFDPVGGWTIVHAIDRAEWEARA